MTLNVEERVHWTTTASPPPECRSLAADITADVAIIGGGLSGCRTAVGLAEAGVSVVLLEANEIGWGASGRSGGQCNPMWRQTPEQLVKRLGRARAERLVETTIGAADALFQDIRTFAVDCDAVQAGWVQAAHARAGRVSLERLQAAWRSAGARIDVLEGGDVERRSGSPAYQYALFHQTGGHVQPLSLTRGYARAAQARGARLYCGQRVDRLQRNGRRWKVGTGNGSVTADQIVITTNAYTRNAPAQGLKQTFLPLTSICLATCPLSESLQASILPGGVTVSDTRHAIFYARSDRDGRLIFGCVGSRDRSDALGGRARLLTGLRTVFPQLGTVGVERMWAGRIAVTPAMMPQLLELAPGVTAALGYSGRGIAMTSVMGRALTRRVLGEPDSTLPFPVQPMTSIPMHGVVNALLPLGAPAMTLKDRFDTWASAV